MSGIPVIQENGSPGIDSLHNAVGLTVCWKSVRDNVQLSTQHVVKREWPNSQYVN